MASPVLVIDDSQTIRKLVELSFRKLPLSVEYATSGTEGVTRAQSNPPDVILLDVVLPDMKGMDVCQKLARDPRTSKCLVVLMTAKDPGIRDQFRAFSQVVGFLQKPFSADDLLSRLNDARGIISNRASLSPATPVVKLTFEQRQAIAQSIYKKAKPHLAQIPEWMGQLGTSQPASFFARRILTPDLIDEMADVLIPHVENALRAAATSAAQVELEGFPLFSGRISTFPLLELLRAISCSQRTGMLELSGRNRKTSLYYRGGTLLMATNDSPDDYILGSEADLSAVPTPAREGATLEQQRSGKPLFVSLAESGVIPTVDLSRLLHRQGIRVLVEALDTPQLQFGWQDLASLPLYVEAQGREISFGQIHLEQLRRSSTALADRATDTSQWLFERVPGFSRRLRQFALSPDERRVLTLIDGQHSVAKVIRRCGLPSNQVTATLHRLTAVDLIRRTEAKGKSVRKVALVDGDIDLQRPLARLLSKRREPLGLIVFRPDDADLVSSIRRERPSLLLVNTSVLGEAAHALAQSVFECAELSRLTMVALLEDQNRQAVDALLVTGFDAVLVKPLYFGDIEGLLVG